MTAGRTRAQKAVALRESRRRGIDPQGITSADATLRAELDDNDYPAGVKVYDAMLADLVPERDAFHGEWSDQLNRRGAMS